MVEMKIKSCKQYYTRSNIIAPIKDILFFPYSVENIQTGKTLGHFYLDPYIRDDKAYAGADKGWYFPLKNRSKFGSTDVLGKFDNLLLSKIIIDLICQKFVDVKPT